MHAKLKNAPGIYLAGFMGCGKSTVGRLLADWLGWEFVDLDEEIETAAGETIAEIFDRHGEAAFRTLERSALLRHTEQARLGSPRVVALGGGCFAQRKNRETLADAGVTIWLDCPVDELWERATMTKERPLARNRPAFEALYRDRREGYEKADYRVSSQGTGPEQVIEAIRNLGLV